MSRETPRDHVRGDRSPWSRARFGGGVVVLLGLFATAWSRAQDAMSPPAEPESSWFFDGHLDVRYGYRADSEQSDQDLREVLSVSFGEEKTRWFSAHLSVVLAQDLDGFHSPDAHLSLRDTDERYYSLLDSAYIDLRPDVPILDSARLGRQWLAEVPEVIRMDGVRLQSRELERTLRTRVVLFGGIPWHVSESSRRGDSVLGLGLTVRPFARTRLMATYARITDAYEQRWVDDSSRVSARDDLVSVEVRQHLMQDRLHFSGLYSNLNGESRDVSGRLTYRPKDANWHASVDYRALFSTQTARSTELDPYYSVLRSYHPYQQARADFEWNVTSNSSVGAGAVFRRVERRSDRGAFNHDFERYFVSASFAEWPLERAPLTLVGNWFDADGDRFRELEASWSFEFSEDFDAELGSGYALHQSDRYTLEERNHVRSLYVGLEYRPTPSLELDARYILEVDDEQTTNSFEVGIRYRF